MTDAARVKARLAAISRSLKSVRDNMHACFAAGDREMGEACRVRLWELYEEELALSLQVLGAEDLLTDGLYPCGAKGSPEDGLKHYNTCEACQRFVRAIQEAMA